MARRAYLTESQWLAAWGVGCGVVLVWVAWAGYSLPLAICVLLVLTIFAPWKWPGAQRQMTAAQASLVRGKFDWVWFVAGARALGLSIARWKTANTLSERGIGIVWSIAIPFGAAFLVRWTLRRTLIEKADRRQLTLFIESAYPIERTNDWGMTRTVGYRIRTAEYGVTKVSSRVYHKLLPNRKVVVIASTVFGLRVHRVLRTARDQDH